MRRHPIAGQRRLITIGPSGWQIEVPRVVDRVGHVVDAVGALVRLRPPADASELDVEMLEKKLLADGAAAVQIEPRAAGVAVVAPEKERPAMLTHRAVIMEMVQEARSEDREALASYLDEILTAEGL